jgi:hypothetical protein
MFGLLLDGALALGAALAPIRAFGHLRALGLFAPLRALGAAFGARFAAIGLLAAIAMATRPTILRHRRHRRAGRQKHRQDQFTHHHHSRRKAVITR